MFADLEKLTAAFVAMCIRAGFSTASIAAALVRAASYLAHAQGVTSVQFLAGVSAAFKATGPKTATDKGWMN